MRSLARSSRSTLVMRNRRHAGAGLGEHGTERETARPALDGDRAQIDVGLAQLHRRRQSPQRDRGEVGALGVALDELERGDAHGRAGLGDRRLVARQREVGLQHALDDAGHRVLDPDAVLLAHADQQARHADLDARRRTGGGWRIAVEAHAAIDERLAHAERELLAADIGERPEPDHVAARRFGLLVGGAPRLDEAGDAELPRVEVDLGPRREQAAELAVEEAFDAAELLALEATDHQRVLGVGDAAVDDGDLDVRVVVDRLAHVGQIPIGRHRHPLAGWARGPMIGVVERPAEPVFVLVTGAAAQRYCAVVLIVHAGNRIDAPDRGEPRFPASQVGAVAQRVGRLLDVMQPAGVVSAPAAGADLIVLDEARRRAIPLHVFLPIEVDEFVRVSVADHDTEWLGLFETVMDHARDDARSSVCRGDGRRAVGLVPGGPSRSARPRHRARRRRSRRRPHGSPAGR